jgi:hypothetical protein
LKEKDVSSLFLRIWAESAKSAGTHLFHISLLHFSSNQTRLLWSFSPLSLVANSLFAISLVPNTALLSEVHMFYFFDLM